MADNLARHSDSEIQDMAQYLVQECGVRIDEREAKAGLWVMPQSEPGTLVFYKDYFKRMASDGEFIFMESFDLMGSDRVRMWVK